MSLKRDLVRLAYSHPELRADLLPLLKEARSYQVYVEDKKKKGEKPLNQKEWEATHKKTRKDDDLKGKGPTKKRMEKERSKLLGGMKKPIQEVGEALLDISKSWGFKDRDGKPYDPSAKVESALDVLQYSGSSPSDPAKLKAAVGTLLSEIDNTLESIKKDDQGVPKKVDSITRRLTKIKDKLKKSVAGYGELVSGINKPEEPAPAPKKEPEPAPKEETKRSPKKKGDPKKDYMEAIQKSDMSPEDKKKALEQAKKPGFDPEAALGAMGDDEEGKKASLHTKLVRLAYSHPELRADLLPLLQKPRFAEHGEYNREDDWDREENRREEEEAEKAELAQSRAWTAKAKPVFQKIVRAVQQGLGEKLRAEGNLQVSFNSGESALHHQFRAIMGKLGFKEKKSAPDHFDYSYLGPEGRMRKDEYTNGKYTVYMSFSGNKHGGEYYVGVYDPYAYMD